MLNVLVGRTFRASSSPDVGEKNGADWQMICQPGDLIFVQRKNFVFRRVSEISQSWTSHVGIVLPDDETSRGKLMVFESCVPWVKRTPIGKFVTVPWGGRVEVRRFKNGLTPQQIDTLSQVARSFLGCLYDFSFNLESKRGMFCSRFVFELYRSIGIEVGKVETFGELASGALRAMTAEQKQKMINFWSRWFFCGSPPANRMTITPASQLRDPKFGTIFSNHSIHSSE